MTITAGDVLKSTVGFTLNDGSICQNIFHYKRWGIGILSDQAHVDAIETKVENMYAEVDDMISDDVSVNLCSVDKVEWVTDHWEIVENIGTFVPTITFAGTGEMLPNQSSAYVLFKTARPKTVGRKFLIPFEESRQSGSYLVQAAVDALVLWGDAALADILLQIGTDWLIPGVVRTGVDAWYPFDLGIVTNVLGSQRRRRPGVGA